MMTRRAWTFVLAVIFLGMVLFIAGLIQLFIWPIQLTLDVWLRFATLTILMTAAQMFKSEAPTHQIYHPNLMFAFAGVLLLPPALFSGMILISHLAEWSKERLLNSPHLRAWYLQPFNISMHIIIGGVCLVIYQALHSTQIHFVGGAFLFSALVAAGAYLLLNHLIVGAALVLARSVSWRDSGILERESLLLDFAMLAMGITVAAMVNLSVWLILPAISPLYLIYRSLSVPNLKRQASTDPKTGLWNAEHFRKTLELELSRSQRFNRPMTVVLADLDFLRNINNVYGHLAGDAVLIGVAEILKKNFRDFDTVARFGGEEFAILMPETTSAQAFNRVEAVRQQIEQAEFHAPITGYVVKATISFGVVSLCAQDQSAVELIHRADLAVYTAKMRGRNCTCLGDEKLPENINVMDFTERIYL
jgi:diguanylate cyclase (GGDEF)-like protein